MIFRSSDHQRMIMKICLLYIILLIGIFSCSRKGAGEGDAEIARHTIYIDPAGVSEEKVNYSSLFDSIHYITVPTDSVFLVGKADKLLVTEDYIFLMDQKVARSVCGIDMQGNKILHLNKTGRGPGEYGLMTDIAYHPQKEELLVYCKMRQRILHYNLRGKFLREEKVPFRMMKFHPLGEGYVFHSEYYDNDKIYINGLSPNLFIYTPQRPGEVKGAAYFRPPLNRSLILNTNCQFSSWGDTVSIKPDHSNMVYHITAEGITPAWKLDFGAYNEDGRYWNMVRKKGVKYKEIKEFIRNAGLCESYWFLESGEYIYFTYRQQGRRKDVLYSKKSGQMKHLQYFRNDMDEITLFYPKAIYKDKIYCLLNSGEVYRARESLKGRLPAEVLAQADEFGNPIIAVFTLKPF